MCKGVEEGVITKERLDEAVVRVLALKAALDLNKPRTLPTLESALQVLGCEEHKQWARECADMAVTLVKEEPGVLPLTPEKYKKILYCPIESGQGVAYSVKAGVCDHFKEMLENEGFCVTTFEPPQGFEGKVPRYLDTVDEYDAIVYLANRPRCVSSGRSPWAPTAPITFRTCPPFLSRWKTPTTCWTCRASRPLSTVTAPRMRP